MKVSKFQYYAGNFNKIVSIVLCTVKVFRAQLSSPGEKLVSFRREATNFRISYQKYVAILEMTRQNVIIWHCATVFPWNLFDNILEIYGKFDPVRSINIHINNRVEYFFDSAVEHQYSFMRKNVEYDVH